MVFVVGLEAVGFPIAMVFDLKVCASLLNVDVSSLNVVVAAVLILIAKTEVRGLRFEKND